MSTSILSKERVVKLTYTKTAVSISDPQQKDILQFSGVRQIAFYLRLFHSSI